MKQFLNDMAWALSLLANLSEEDLEDLRAGTAKITVTRKASKDKVKPKNTELVDQTCEEINSFSTREEVIELLSDKKYKKDILIQIAQKYDAHINKSKDTRDKLISKIAEVSIGAKLRYDVLLGSQ